MKKPCARAGCRELVDLGVRWCDAHKVEYSRQDALQRGTARERGYNARWEREARAYRNDHPLCAECERQGRLVRGVLVDHVVPHKGDQTLFWDRSNWQTLCDACHRAKSAAEGAFGTAAAYPAGLTRSVVPVVVVCGPAGGGKSTLVRASAAPGDLVLDLDEIRALLEGVPVYEASARTLEPALRYRNERLRSLGRAPCAYPRAWVIATSPLAVERTFWRTHLGARVVVLETPLLVCLARIRADPRRARDRASHEAHAQGWWERYVACYDDEIAPYECARLVA